jgi:ubiquinone biosynthesis monooxygenase Coq7
MSSRHYSTIDTLLMNFDQGLRTVFGRVPTTGRDDPAGTIPEDDLKPAEQRRSARLMRVNHTGEICAQALYQGQALTARKDEVRGSLEQAAAEENDHLAWCESRVKDLGSHTSVLNPLFYGASFAFGALAGQAGDRWSLGFLAETERQVVRHLEEHLHRLPQQDRKSRAILAKMKEDESRHAESAVEGGGADLPLPVRLLMRTASKVMTKTTYWM